MRNALTNAVTRTAMPIVQHTCPIAAECEVDDHFLWGEVLVHVAICVREVREGRALWRMMCVRVVLREAST